MQHKFNIMQAVQQTGMNHVHDVGEINGAVGAFCPAALPAKKFACARMSQQSFHWPFEIHARKIRAQAIR
jgi:hypothetical protein